MEMKSADRLRHYREALRKLFPDCVKEAAGSDGEPGEAVDFEKLRAYLGEEVKEQEERYEFTWVGKQKAFQEAHRRTDKTLRPAPEKSVDWEHTENLYLEGDNLEILKLLQESYMGRIKLIYIDPPYNTGSDLIYRDRYALSVREYDREEGAVDDEGNRLFRNTQANGRFHSEWCSMMYPRLLLARNLLSRDGVICISMDEHEDANLKNICDEVFGHGNRIGEVIRKTKSMTGDQGNGFNLQHEILLIYGRDSSRVQLHGEEKEFSGYANPDQDPKGDWCPADPSARSGGASTMFGIENPYTHRIDYPPAGRYWAFSRATLDSYIQSGRVKFKKEYGEKERGFIFKRYKNGLASPTEPVNSLFGLDNEYMNQAATIELKKLFGEPYFSYPKPVSFIKKLIRYTDADLILDFFSGSATTAQAVMELSAEDGKKRNFILVQLPEEVAPESPAGQAGYQTLCDIGQERIRRAAEQIRQADPEVSTDRGFRVFYLDESNRKDVFHSPEDTDQSLLAMLESNLKEDRTGLDLLFGCVLESGLPLSLPCSTEILEGCTVYVCQGGELMACFDEGIPEQAIRAMAGRQPGRIVFRDSSFSGSPAKINAEAIFKCLSPGTRVQVL